MDGWFLGGRWLFLIVGFVFYYGLNGCGGFVVMDCRRGGKIMWVWVAGVVLQAVGWILCVHCVLCGRDWGKNNVGMGCRHGGKITWLWVAGVGMGCQCGFAGCGLDFVW